MSREPRLSAPRRAPAPYPQKTANFRPPSALPAAPSFPLAPAPAAETARSGPRRLTFNNIDTFTARAKKLPPDANVSAATHAQLLQLSERASFYCSKCRRDQIISDSLAVDAAHRVMLCTRCFTRIVRPRAYRPSRVVPFPSLLSWLNYKPARVVRVFGEGNDKDKDEDIASRPAEAVAPSGERVAANLIGGGGGERPARMQSLPPSAMHTAASSGTRGLHAQHKQQQSSNNNNSNQHDNNSNHNGDGGESVGEHPCGRVWGTCAHGETCFFRRAPRDLCLCFLMGLCAGKEDTCRLLHQHVFDLPNAEDPMPPARYEGETQNANSAWGKWLARRRNSLNRAEWQLWHNGPVDGLLDVYAPLATREKASEENEESEEKKEKEGADERAKPGLKLNFADISAALRGLNQ